MDSELILTDYEKGYLTAFYEGYIDMQEYKCPNGAWYEHLDDDMEWVGVSIGDRHFDLCMYFDVKPDPEYPDELIGMEYPKDLIVKVSECHPDGTGCYTTDTSFQYYLKEKTDADTR